VKDAAQDRGLEVLIFPMAIFRWRVFFSTRLPRTLPERCTTKAKLSPQSVSLEVGILESQDAQGWPRAHSLRPTRTASSSSSQAPFERSKLVVGAACPGAVFETSYARFGDGGVRPATRLHGEVFLHTRRCGKEVRGRMAISSAQLAWARARWPAGLEPGAGMMCSSVRVGVAEGDVA